MNCTRNAYLPVGLGKFVDEAADLVRDTPVAGRKSSARIWWLVHQWVGLKLSILMSFVLLTGTIAVFSYEIDWAIFPAARVDPASVEGPTNWAGMAKAIHAYEPDGKILWLDGPYDRWFSGRAAVERADGSWVFIGAHPTTGEVLGEIPWANTARVFRNMHRHLFMPTKIGVPIVTSMGILLLITLVTAFVVYKKWWRGFLKLPRLTNARTFFGDFHRLAGVWSLWFVALMAATGIWYLLENVAIPAPGHRTAEIPGTMSVAEQVDHLALSVEAQRKAWPELRVVSISFPEEGERGLTFVGHADALLVRARSNAVWTDALTGEVKLVTHGDQLSPHQRIAEMADPLHFGDFGGLTSKIIWFLFGLLLTGLSVSGSAIYALRLARRPVDQKPAGALLLWWRGMGLWKWPALGLLVVGAYLIPASLAV